MQEPKTKKKAPKKGIADEREPTALEAEVLQAIAAVKQEGTSERTVHGYTIKTKVREVKPKVVAEGEEPAPAKAPLRHADLTVVMPDGSKFTSVLAVKRAMGLLPAQEKAAEKPSKAEKSPKAGKPKKAAAQPGPDTSDDEGAAKTPSAAEPQQPAAPEPTPEQEPEPSPPAEEPEEPSEDDGQEWQYDGHEWIGVFVARSFGRAIAVGQIYKWLPPDGEDAALFKVKHLDGDREDLEVYEVEEALEKYKTTGHFRQEERRKEKQAERQAKAEAKAEKENEKKRAREEREQAAAAKAVEKAEKAKEKEAAKAAKAAEPKLPKKPRTAYSIYLSAAREGVVAAIKAEDPEAWEAGRVPPGDVTKRLADAWKNLSKEDRGPYETQAAADKQRYLTECEEAGIEPEEGAKRAKKAKTEGEGEESAAPKEKPAKPLKEKKQTPKQLARARLDAVLAAAAREQESALAFEKGMGPPAHERPEPRGVMPLAFEQASAEEVLAVWSFARSLSVQLGLSPFDVDDFARALERPGQERLLAELHLRLLRVLLRDVEALRNAGLQLPPPSQVALLLQQLPTAETVTAANWPEVLRSVGHLLEGLSDEQYGAPEALSVLERHGYSELAFSQRLALLRLLCDATCGTLGSELKANYDAEVERETEAKAQIREMAKECKEKQTAALQELSAANAKPAKGKKKAAKGEEEEAGGEEEGDAEKKKKCVYYMAIGAPKPDGSLTVGDGKAEAEGKGDGKVEGEGEDEGEGEGEGKGGGEPEWKVQRDQATETLLEALESRDEEALKAAVKAAEGAWHEGDHADGRRWCTSELKEARAALQQHAERAVGRELGGELEERKQQETRERHEALKKAPMREELLGRDRSGRGYWILGRDMSRLWVQARPPTSRGDASNSGDGASSSGSAGDWHWMYVDKLEDLTRLIDSLDGCGSGGEAALKAALQEHVPLWEEEMESYDEGEAEAAVEAWELSGHEWIGRRVLRVFKAKDKWSKPTSAVGSIVRWLKEDKDGDGPYFHCVHDDGDEEDLEEDEAREAIEKHEAAPEEELNAMWSKVDDPKYENRLEKKAMRALKASGVVEAMRDELLELEESLLPALQKGGTPWDNNGRGSNPFRNSSRDKFQKGCKAASSADELVPQLIALEAAVRALQDKSIAEGRERKPWRVDGCEYIGSKARRFFEMEDEAGEPVTVVSSGTIVGWLPAEGDDEALWHMVHDDDSDEEDLDEHEVDFALANYREDRSVATSEEAAYIAKVEEENKRKAEEEEDDDDDEEKEEEEGEEDVGRQSADGEMDATAEKSSLRLWLSAECRERWLASVQPDGEAGITDGALALALCALRQHCQLFGPARLLPKKKSDAVAKRREVVASVGAYYHASSNISAHHRVGIQKKRKPGRPKK